MKRILAVFAALLSISSMAATLTPIQLLQPAGSTSGQVIASTGAASAPAWTTITLSGLGGVVPVTNGGTGAVTAGAALTNLGALSTATAASIYLTQATATSTYLPITTAASTYAPKSGNLSQFAATTSAQLAGVISDETGSGAAVFATGAAVNPASTGATTPGIGAFTTLSASANDALMYTNTSGQSIPTGTNTTVTTWTKTFDRVNANFNASSGTFTAPVTGIYQVSAQLAWSGAAAVVQSTYTASIVANGVTVATGRYQMPVGTTSLGPVVSVSALVSLTAGQTIIIQANQSSGAAYALTAGASLNFLSINRVP